MEYDEDWAANLLANMAGLAEVAGEEEAVRTQSLALAAQAESEPDILRVEHILREAFRGRTPTSRLLRQVRSLLLGDPYVGPEYFHFGEHDGTAPQRLRAKRVSYAVNAALGMSSPPAGGVFERRLVRIDDAWWRLGESGSWARHPKGKEDVHTYITDAYKESPKFLVAGSQKDYKALPGDEGTDSMISEAYSRIAEYARPPALREGRMDYADRWKPFDLLTGEKPPDLSVPLKDVVLEIDAAGDIAVREHDTRRFFQLVRDYSWADGDTDAPLFAGYMADLARGNEYGRHQAMIALGQIACGENPWQKVVMLIGSRRTGKSVFSGLCEALAGGPHACVELTLKGLSNKFVAPQMAGCALVQFDEVGARPTGGQARDAYTDGLLYLKKLVGGDKLEGRNMYTTQNEKFSMAGVNVLMTSNDPPRFAGDLEGDAGAWEDRIYPIPFVTETPPGSRNPNLLAQMLAAELPAIAAQAIEYWATSQERLTGVYELDARAQGLLVQIAVSDFRFGLDALSEEQGSVVSTPTLRALAALALGFDDLGQVTQQLYRKFRGAVLTRFPDATPDAWTRIAGRSVRGIGNIAVTDARAREMIDELAGYTPQPKTL